LKILLSAFACRPDRGSEPGVGWNWARSLSARHEVHVVTQHRNQAAIEAELEHDPLPNTHFHYVPMPFRRTAGWPLGLGWLPYYWWQWKAHKHAAKLHAEHHFDVVHHVTYVVWRAPSFMWKLGMPFVWGPVGGGQNIPRGFHRVLGWRGAVRERIRELAQELGWFHPSVRATARGAAIILAANTPTKDVLPRIWRNKAHQMLDAAVSERALMPARSVHAEASELRLLWVGQLVPIKGLRLLLQAIAAIAPPRRLSLSVIGEGPERPGMEQLASSLRLTSEISFAGWVPHPEVSKSYSAADALVFTSLRDSSGNALLEAMAAGLPAICLDWAGPGDITTDECAVRIFPQSPGQVIRDLASAIVRLRDNPELRLRMGTCARARVLTMFTWERKALELEGLLAKLPLSGEVAP